MNQHPLLPVMDARRQILQNGIVIHARAAANF
jgi:hypothetical protein